MPRTPPVKAPDAINPDTNYPIIKGPKAVTAVDEFVRLTAEKKAIEAKIKEHRAYLLELMGEAPVIHIGTRVVSVSEVRGTIAIPARPVTKDMVGQMLPAIPGRAGYQLLNVR